MTTRYVPLPGLNAEQKRKAITDAAFILRNGGLVAFPTETVYGLGANALSPSAVSSIFKAKGRPRDNPLILHIAAMDTLKSIAVNVPEAAKKLADAFWPGPLTLVLQKADAVPLETSGGLLTAAVRFPAHQTAAELIRACGFPVAAPSANLSGRPSPTTGRHVLEDLNGKVDMILDDGPCAFGLESTIVDVSGDTPCLLRPGAVTPDMLRAVCGGLDVDPALLAEANARPKAPGMKYTHYAPLAQVTVFCGLPEDVAAHINRLLSVADKKTGVLATDQTAALYDADKAVVLSAGNRENLETVGRNLFALLRRFDVLGVEAVFAEGFSEEGVGLAIMNRLKKAAGGRIVTV